jgi:kynurenine formamidase
MCDICVMTSVKERMPSLRDVFGGTAAAAAGATLMVGAPKVRGGTGGPARIMALA